MNTQNDSSEETKKSSHVLLKRLFFLLLLLFVAFSFLPKIVSSRLVTGWLLATVNANSPVLIEVDKLDVSWNRGFSAQQLALTLEDGHRVEVEQISGSAGLIPVFRHRNLGEVTVEGMDILWLRPEVIPETPAVSTPRTPGTAPSKSASMDKPSSENTPLWPNFIGIIRIVEGSLSVQSPGQTPEKLLSPVEGRLDLLNGAALGSLSLVAPFCEKQGKLVVLGDVKKTMSGTKALLALPLTLNLTVRDANLAEQEVWLVGVAGTTDAKGEMNASMSLKGTLAEGLEMRASLLASDFELNAEALGTDTVALESFQLDGEAMVHLDKIVPSELSVNSDVGTLFLKPADDTDGQRYEVEIKGNLPRLATMLPETLGLKEGIAVHSGMASINARVALADGNTQLQGAMSVDDLAGQSSGQKIQLSESLEVDFDMAMSPSTLDVKALNFNSSFLSAQGAGTLDDFELNGSLDLATALTELGQFIELNDTEASGTIDLRLGIKSTDQAGEYSTEGGLDFSQVQLSTSDPSSMKPWDGSVRLQGSMQPEEQGWKYNEQLFVNLPWVQGRVNLVDVRPMAEGGLSVDRWEAKGRLHITSNMPGEMSKLLAGQGAVDAQGYLREGKLSIERAAVQIPGAGDEGAGLGVSFAGQLDLSQKTFAMHQLDLSRPGLAIVNDGVFSEQGGRIELSSNLEVLQGWFDTDAALKMSGGLKGHVELEALGRVVSQISFDKVVFSEDGFERVDLNSGSLEFVAMNSEQELRFEKLLLQSSGVQMNATGSLAKGDSGVLHLEGDLGYDLEKVVAGFPILKKEGVVAMGISQKPFLLDLPLAGESEQRFNELKASLSFMAERIEAYGLGFSELEIPVVADAGTLQASVQGVVEQGIIDFQPSLYYDQGGPVLMVNTGVEVISKIQLTPELADRVFGRIHPVFKGATVAEGKVSLLFNDFVLPLEEEKMAEGGFSGMMYFRGVKLSVEGMLEEVLQMAKIDSSELEVGDRDIQFECRDGFIQTDPLEVKVKGELLRLSGKMSIGGALDYVAEVPLSEDLVGKEVAEYAGNQTLKIPIGGTASKPRIDRDAVRKSLAGLTRDVGKDLLQEKAKEILGGDAQKVLDKLFR